MGRTNGEDAETPINSVSSASSSFSSASSALRAGLGRSLEMLREEVDRAGPRVLGGRLAVAAPGVVGVGEGVAGPFVELHVDRLAGFLERRLEGPHLVGRGALVLRAVVAENGRLDPGDRGGVGGR